MMRAWISKYSLLVFLVFLTIIFSILILVPNYRHFPVSTVPEIILVVLHYGLSTLGLLAIFILLSLNKYIFAVLFPLFIFLSSLTAFFVWHIDISINLALIESIIYTDVWEVSSYLSWKLILYILFCCFFAVLFVVFRFKIRLTRLQILPLTFLFVFSSFLFILTNKLRFNSLLQRAPFAYYLSINDYLESRKELSQVRILVGDDSVSEADTLITVLVIGEALRSDHVQMGGYERLTMPNMEERGVIYYPNIHSPHTHTVSSLRYFLTRSTESNSEPMFQEGSFINAFKAGGYYTSWLANQNPLTPLRFFISESDTVIVNRPEISDYSNMKKLDSELIPYFKDLVAEKHPLKLIIVHLAGNHWWYNKNFPDSFAIFTPILNNRELSDNNRERMINSYDNITLFVDYVLNELIGIIEDKSAFMIFLSDHGQSFGEDGNWLHANDAPAEQNPACFFWFSDSYGLRYPEKVEAVSLNSEKQTDTSFLFHTILDGSLITSSYLDLEMSLFAKPSQP